MTGNGGILHSILYWNNLCFVKGETPALAAGQEDSCYRAGGEGIKRT